MRFVSVKCGDKSVFSAGQTDGRSVHFDRAYLYIQVMPNTRRILVLNRNRCVGGTYVAWFRPAICQLSLFFF